MCITAIPLPLLGLCAEKCHLAAESDIVGESSACLRSLPPEIGYPPISLVEVTRRSHGSDESLEYSSVFRRVKSGGHVSHGRVGTTGPSSLSDGMLPRTARVDVQHRFRLMPATLWGNRERRTNKTTDAATSLNQPETPAVTVQQSWIRKEKRTFGLVAIKTGGEITDGVRDRGSNERGPALAGRKMRTSYGASGCSSDFFSPKGRTCIEAAALKKPAVTSSVPLSLQSRVVSLSSLRDHGVSRSNTSLLPSKTKAGAVHQPTKESTSKRCVQAGAEVCCIYVRLTRERR